MLRDVRILTAGELRALVALDATLIDAVEGAFAALARGGVVMPPVMSMELPDRNAEVDVKTAYVPGLPGFAVKVSPGFFDNAAPGLPSLSGLMVLLSARTGRVEAVLLDDGYLTDLRTAAAGAVAARHLAPTRVNVAGVVGTGMQARLQMRAAHLVRPFARGLVWGRDAAKAAVCAADLEASLGVPVAVAQDVAGLVAAAQLVVTTTPARTPLVTADMLHPGLHVTAMGADQAGKSEVAPEALAAADLYVCDSVAQCERLGELRGACEAGLWSGPSPPELGAIVTGRATGRTSDDATTICDLTGTGAQDTAIACHVLAALPEAGTRIAV